MQLDHLPHRVGGAAENMATDFLLLQRYPSDTHARFRHYGWHRPAFTFGYSQPIAFVREQLPPDLTCELCRRPTGGGVVDHRADWTYALVIPRDHALHEERATESYRIVHACIAAALKSLGEPAVIKEPADAGTSQAGCGPGVCFTKAENFDVLRADTGVKIAGAAQKRSKNGLLFQGSIARATVSPSLDWDGFEQLFVDGLARALELPAVESPWPEIAEDELSALTEQYSTEEWNSFR